MSGTAKKKTSSKAKTAGRKVQPSKSTAKKKTTAAAKKATAPKQTSAQKKPKVVKIIPEDNDKKTTVTVKTPKRPVTPRPLKPAKVEAKKEPETPIEKLETAVKDVTAPAKKPIVIETVKPEKPVEKVEKPTEIVKPAATTTRRKPQKRNASFGFKRILLALACAGAAVFAIVYFVNLNTPNIELKVATMQSGIDAKYPSYVPRDYSLSDITSENGKITLNFKSSALDAAFSIVEEKSVWDSNAVEANYVKEAYGDNYTVIKEQGLTLFVNGSDAAWVNGGIFYRLKTTSGSLTKKQIKAIAVSL